LKQFGRLDATQLGAARADKDCQQQGATARPVAWKRSNTMARWTRSLAASLLTLGMALGAAAQAQTPLPTPGISVPSTPDASGQITIRGNALAALSNVTVRFAHEQAAAIDMVAQTSSSGSFTLKFQPPLAGAYAVTVFDAKGQPLGQGRFSLIR
jgi:hypothetical protein